MTMRIRGLAVLALLTGCTTGGGSSTEDTGFIPLPDTGPLPDVGPRTDAGPPPVDAGSPCPPGVTLCPDRCTNLLIDPMNCGGCGTVCAAGEVCLDGTCLTECMDPRVRCPVRPEGGGDPMLVCVDPQTDGNHCGTCGTRCGGGSTCTMGRCACPMGMRSCTGRCVDPATDVDHCGFCGNDCGAGGVCTGGRCTTCGTGRTDCSGLCADLMTDATNCGMCARPCGFGETCMGGLCTCASPRTDCGSGCTDTRTDVRNCGMCGVSCGPGGVCRLGVCECALGLTMCGASCRDTMNDRLHCGMCDNACPMGEFCIMGACTDAPPTRYMETRPTAAEVPFVDACAAMGATTHLPAADDSSTRVTLPFPFRYWATDLPSGAMINITSNGWIGMDGATSASLFGMVPSATTPNAVIAAHWNDGHTRTPGICVATVGTAPSRQWIVQWQDAYYCCGEPSPSRNTYQVVLHEGSGVIDLVYESIVAPELGAMGLEDQTGTMGINSCAPATECNPSTGLRVRYLPIP